MAQTLFDVLSESNDSQVVEEEVVEVQQPKEAESPRNQGQIDFFEMAAQQEPEKEEGGGYWMSVLNSIPKGAVKGIIQFGRMMGPLPDTEDYKYEPEKIAEQLDEWFPTQDDSGLAGGIETGLSMAPTILGSPGGIGASGLKGTTARIAIGAAAGQGAKKLDMPEWVQTVAETVPLLAPSLSAANKAGATEGALTKIIADKAPQKIADRAKEMMSKNASKKELLDFARQAGMTEAEITPLLQGEVKQKWLSKLASKGESTQSKLKATQESIGNVFNSIKDSPAAQKVLTEKQSTKLVKGLQDKFEQMPASVRNAVQDDFQQLLKGEMTGEKIIKFFRDINHELGSKTKQLSTLKDPIKKTLMELDPELGRSFDMTNKLYGKYAQIAKRLKPSEHDKLYAAGKGGLALTSLLKGNFGVIKGLATYEGARKLSEHMLTNPRMQNLSTKMISALNQNKFQVAEHIKRQMIDEIKDVDPRVAKALQELNIKLAIESE